MGNFVNRLSASILESRHLKSADFVIDASAANRLDEVVSKIKAGAKAGDLNSMDRAAIEVVTKDLVRGLPKNADGTPTTRSVVALQKAYSHGILVEFGAGNSAEAAIKTFKDTVTEVIKKEQIGAGVSGAAVDTTGLEKMSVRNLNRREAVDRAAEARATERISTQRAATADPTKVGGDNPHIDSQTALLNAETAQKQIERTENFISGWASGQDNSRNLFLSQMDNLQSPNFATRKAAYNALTATTVTPEGKATDVIGFSGYIARDADGARSVQKYLESDERLSKLRSLHPEKSDEQIQALKGKPRTIKEIEDIFKTKPGYAWEKVQDKTLTQEQRIEALTKIDPKNRITTAEWDAYRSQARQGFLQLERQDVLNKLDTLRLTRKADAPKAALEEQFTKLREISRDPDYQKAIAEQNGASVVRIAQDTKDAPKTISARLKEGQPVSEGDINRLEVYYTRHFADRGAAAKSEGATWKDKIASFFTSSDQKLPSTADRWSEWNLGFRVSPASPGSLIANSWKPLAGTLVAGSVVSGTWVWFNPGDYDEKSPTGFSQKEPNLLRKAGVTVTSSFIGDLLVPDAQVTNNGVTTNVEKTLYSSAVKTELNRNPSKAPRWVALGNSEAPTAPAVQSAISEVNQVRSVNIDSQATQRAADKNRVEQDLAAGTREFARDVTSIGRQGISVGEVNDAIAKQYESGAITTDQMQKLANQMAKISAQDGKEVMSRTEFETAMKDPAMTGLPVTVQTAVSNELKPKLP